MNLFISERAAALCVSFSSFIVCSFATLHKERKWNFVKYFLCSGINNIMNDANSIYKLYAESVYTLEGEILNMFKEIETRIGHLESNQFRTPEQQAANAGRISELTRIKEQLSDIIANYVD